MHITRSADGSLTSSKPVSWTFQSRMEKKYFKIMEKEIRMSISNDLAIHLDPRQRIAHETHVTVAYHAGFRRYSSFLCLTKSMKMFISTPGFCITGFRSDVSKHYCGFEVCIGGRALHGVTTRGGSYTRISSKNQHGRMNEAVPLLHSDDDLDIRILMLTGLSGMKR